MAEEPPERRDDAEEERKGAPDRPAWLPPEPPGPPPPPPRPAAPPPPPPAPTAYGQPVQTGPDNTAAVVGLVCGIVSLGLLLTSAGLSSIFSLGLGIAAIVYG